MEKIREFLDVKSINKIVRTRDNYVETSYEVITSKKSSPACGSMRVWKTNKLFKWIPFI